MCKPNQQGYSMPAAMIAVLVFSVTALALMHYLQRLADRQAILNQYRQALALSHQALEGYGAPVLGERLEHYLGLPAGWRLNISVKPLDKGCAKVSAQVITSRGQHATLSEWRCLPPLARAGSL